MKEIKAYCRPAMIEPVVSALEKAGASDLAVIRVDAFGQLADTSAAEQSERGQSPGVVNGFIAPSGQGEWHASLSYQNGKTKHSTTFTVNILP